jgi:hypothetical protein
VWTEARKEALTPAQYGSPLGRRPYDLRHAAVSLWLNSGVPATEVAPSPAARSSAGPCSAMGRWSRPGPPSQPVGQAGQNEIAGIR